MVSNDARPAVRSTFGPVSRAYEPELKVGFCADRPNSCGCVSVRRRGTREADSSWKLADSAGRAAFMHPTRSATMEHKRPGQTAERRGARHCSDDIPTNPFRLVELIAYGSKIGDDKYRRDLWRRGVRPVIAGRATEHGSGLRHQPGRRRPARALGRGPDALRNRPGLRHVRPRRRARRGDAHQLHRGRRPAGARTRPTQDRPGTGSRRSKAATTRPTSSGSTRTSRRPWPSGPR